MEINTTCPLGCTCEEIKDNQIYRCAWYQKLVGTDAQGNARDEFACSIAWLPMLMVEQMKSLSGVQEATESNRNETAQGLQMLAVSLHSRQPIKTISAIVENS